MNEYGVPGSDPTRPFDPANPAEALIRADADRQVDPADPVNDFAASSDEPVVPVDPADPMAPKVPVAQERPMRTWLWPTLLVFGAVIGVGLVVMVLVSSADFEDEPAQVTPTPGACQPFCTATEAPPAP